MIVILQGKLTESIKGRQKMKKPKTWGWIIFGISWLTVPFLDTYTIKRFLPASVFIVIAMQIENMIEQKRKWRWLAKLPPKMKRKNSFYWGPLFISSLWVLKLSYGRFFQYLGISLVMDTIFNRSIIRLKKRPFLRLFMAKSLLLYGFQYVKEHGE